MTVVERVSPGGAAYRITVDAPREALAIASSVRFSGGSYGRGFMMGGVGYHDFAIAHFVSAADTGEGIVHGRRLRVAATADGNTTIATLIGDFHELMTVWGGPAPRLSTIQELFGVLRVRDRVDGMLVRTRQSALLGQASEVVDITAIGCGSVTVQGPETFKSTLPAHAGLRGSHAEIWRYVLPDKSGSRPSDFGYLLGFPSAVVEATLSEELSDADAMEWLDGIDVEFTGVVA